MQSVDSKYYLLTSLTNYSLHLRQVKSVTQSRTLQTGADSDCNRRIDEMQYPVISIDRALEQYLQLSYSENWICQRLKSIEIRKELESHTGIKMVTSQKAKMALKAKTQTKQIKPDNTEEK